MALGRRRISPVTTRVVVPVLALVAVVTIGCAEPEQDPRAAPTQTPPAGNDVDVETDEHRELHAALEEVSLVLSRIEDQLEDATQAEDLSEAHGASDDALALLIADGTAETALLPSQTLERSVSASSPDLLNVTINLAHDVGGVLGQTITELMRDPVAGDLGGWQRDAGGMVNRAERAGSEHLDLLRMEAEILALDGEASRALAWTYAIRSADDVARAHEAAERALAHVEIMLVAVDEVLRDLGGVTDDEQSSATD